jgi:hypothetical protein
MLELVGGSSKDFDSRALVVAGAGFLAAARRVLGKSGSVAARGGLRATWRRLRFIHAWKTVCGLGNCPILLVASTIRPF